MFDFSSEKTEVAVDKTLNRLGLEYVDIIQVCQAKCLDGFTSDTDTAHIGTISAAQSFALCLVVSSSCSYR